MFFEVKAITPDIELSKRISQFIWDLIQEGKPLDMEIKSYGGKTK